MEDKKLKNVISQVKKVSLSQDEKSRILHNLSLYTDVHQQIPTTHTLFAFFNISLNKKLAIVLASVMIAVIVGGTAVYASEGSLPGDLLYPIKTRIVEPLKVALAGTPEEKADVEAGLAVERLKEAETLDQRGKLTQDFKKALDNNVEKHFADFSHIKKQMAGTSSDEINKKIKNEFDNKIRNHFNMFIKLNDEFRNATNTEKKQAFKEIIKKPATSTIKNIKKVDYKNNSSGEDAKRLPFQENL
jgi:hypothetical protein